MNVDSSEPKATPGLQVVGLGLGRTGTGSLKAALEQLGYKVLHMSEHPKNLDHFSTQWNEIYKKVDNGTVTRADWDKLYGDYTACMDYPSAMFPSELLAAYPHAKFILSVRDTDKWFKSTEETIHRPNAFPIRQLAPLVGPARSAKIRSISTRIWNVFFQGDFRKNGKRVFEEHNARCQEIIPADRLLVWEVKEGWLPVCTFLGVPVPDTPFPHDNEGKKMAAQMNEWQSHLVHTFLKQYVAPGVGALAVLGAVFASRGRLAGMWARWTAA